MSGLVPVHKETFANLMELVERQPFRDSELKNAIELAKRELGLQPAAVEKAPKPTRLRLIVNR